MNYFKVHTKETASAASAELLGNAEKAFGFIPNLLGVMAESPATLNAYLTLGQLFDSSSFTATERQVAILAISRYNECHYCMAAHSVVAGMQNVPADVIQAIRNDEPIADERLEALRWFANQVVDKRGWVSGNDIDTFLDAGFTRAQILEVILSLSFKTLSNYINHVANTPLDSAFAAQSWQPADKRLAS